MAPTKSYAIFLNGRERNPSIEVSLDGQAVPFCNTAEYLGVMVDSGMTGTPHVRYASAKALKVAQMLARLMPRTRGVRDSRRRLLALVVDSVLLYAAPIWAPNVRKRTVRDLLNKAQRPLLIRLSRANRTISTSAAQVIAGQISYDLQCRILLSRDHQDSTPDDDDPPAYREEEARLDWRRRWSETAEGDPGYWTVTIIPTLEPWLSRKHGQMTYPLAQMLSGHGIFVKYLRRIAKVESDTCLLCPDAAVDDAKHTFEDCQATQPHREKLQQDSGLIPPPLTCRRILKYMVQDEIAWKHGCDFAASVIRLEDLRTQEHIRRLNITTDIPASTNLLLPAPGSLPLQSTSRTTEVATSPATQP